MWGVGQPLWDDDKSGLISPRVAGKPWGQRSRWGGQQGNLLPAAREGCFLLALVTFRAATLGQF